jgi:N-dimethylarginine dimethylaminohydrolase
MAAFGAHHEGGWLRVVVIGLAPAEDMVVFHEESQRWLTPAAAGFSRGHAGRRLLDVDAELARRGERQVDALAELVGREGVRVHRPERLRGEERAFMAPNGEGHQLFARDAMIVVGDRVIDASLRLRCRQRERFGLRPVIQRMVAERGARWSSVPFGSPAAVDGPFLEGGDVLLNGRQVYVGMSGCASDMAGIDWLQALLGSDHRVIPVALRSNVLHLDGALALIRPGLLVWCPPRLIDGLPGALRDWDKIEVSVEEATLLAASVLVLDEGRAMLDAGNARVTGELKRRGIEVIPLPFDGPIGLGGGLRSAHHPLLRESALA